VSTILIATDGSGPALAAEADGLELARALGDEVLFVSVWQPVLGASFGVPPTYVSEEVLESEKGWAETVLAAAAGRAGEAGVAAETVLLEGMAAEQICHLAADRAVRMIVIGSHGWGAMRTLLSRSTVSGVLAHAPCPVLSGTPAKVAVAPAEPATDRQAS
jgi:nucleotide-binding universal stress UspA family protein